MPDLSAKSALRRIARERRAAFVAGLDHPAFSPGSTAQWTARLRPGIIIASYRPYGNEIDPAPLESIGRAHECLLVHPRIGADRVMRFHPSGPGAVWEAGLHGIEQPSEALPPQIPDLVLLPLLAFDRTGTRLGQGGGHYDRTLAAMTDAIKIGVAWSVQEMVDLPRDPWDVPINAIITEKEWIEL